MRLRSFLGLGGFLGLLLSRSEMTCKDLDAFAKVRMFGDDTMEFRGTTWVNFVGIDLVTITDGTERAIRVWIWTCRTRNLCMLSPNQNMLAYGCTKNRSIGLLAFSCIFAIGKSIYQLTRRSPTKLAYKCQLELAGYTAIRQCSGVQRYGDCSIPDNPDGSFTMKPAITRTKHHDHGLSKA